MDEQSNLIIIFFVMFIAGFFWSIFMSWVIFPKEQSDQLEKSEELLDLLSDEVQLVIVHSLDSQKKMNYKEIRNVIFDSEIIEEKDKKKHLKARLSKLQSIGVMIKVQSKSGFSDFDSYMLTAKGLNVVRAINKLLNSMEEL